MKLLGISGTIIGSKCLALTKNILEEVRRLDPSLETELLDLKTYKLEFCDGRKTADYSEDTQKMVAAVSKADILVIASPIFQGSIPGVLKNLIDLVPPDVFRHKAVGMAAVGGNAQHYLVMENQLKPILGYLQTFVAPGSVFAHSDQFNASNEVADPKLQDAIKNLANELLMLKGILGQKAGSKHG